MQTGGKFFDDLAKLMNNAVGVAQGAKSEAENAFNSWMDRWLAERNLVTREEFDAVRSMAQLAREENEALKARVADLESAVGSGAEPLGLKKVVTLSEIAQRLDWNPVRVRRRLQKMGISKKGGRYSFTVDEAREIVNDLQGGLSLDR